MERETSDRSLLESRDPSASDLTPPHNPAQTLIAALASYVNGSRNKADVRQAINTWCRDAVNAGLPPERALIDFKEILLVLESLEVSPDMVQRMADHRELITMCIEEYYR